MPELKIDLETPNRFISSLSKSLQALCHGCMEFDSGIEIMGYININIDSGNKIDYVLNEKVMKSNTNSMTFVSNSFVAIKDQPKQTLDGSCSPIPELQSQPQSFHNATSNFQHHRPSNLHPSHSQVLQGARKRSWGGMERDWRNSPQKHSRRGRPTYARVHGSCQPSETQPSSSQTYDSLNFESNVSQNQAQPPHSETDSVSVKQEIDGGGGLQNIETFSESVNASSDGACVDANIKSEPSSLPLNELDTTNVTEGDLNVDSKGDILGNFLEGVQQPTTIEQAQSANQTVGEFPSFGDDFPQNDKSEASENSLAHKDFNEPHADLSIPGTSYANEQSRDSFDIIEIGDEDEDPDIYQDARKILDTSDMYIPSLYREWDGQHSQPKRTMVTSISAAFMCLPCGKRFNSRNGLKYHKQSLHKGQAYSCPVCDQKFTQTSSLRRHVKTIHCIDPSF